MSNEIIEKTEVKMHRVSDSKHGRKVYLKAALFLNDDDEFSKSDDFIAERHPHKIVIYPKHRSRSSPPQQKKIIIDEDYGI